MSRRRALFLAAVAAAAAGLAGCSLIVSTDGLASGPASVAEDGGDAASLPAGDGSTVDDAKSEDGAASDGSGGDATVPPFCASLSPKPRYCADFDEGTISDYGRVDGTPTIDPTVSMSPPASMLAIVEADATVRYAKTVEDFMVTPSSFDVAFDMLVDEYDSAHDVELVGVVLTQGASKDCIVNVSIRTDHWTVDETCNDGASTTVDMDHRSATALQPAHWTHVGFSVSFTARTLSLTIDGQTALSAVALQPLMGSGSASLAMGINYLQTIATSRTKLHVDNVTFDYN